MSGSIVDLFKAETEIEIKAGELFAIMREATKAEFMLNAVQCEVPFKYIREMATGQQEVEEELPFPDENVDQEASNEFITVAKD